MLYKSIILFLSLLFCGVRCGDGKICNSISMTMSPVGKAQTFFNCTAVDGNVVLSIIDMNGAVSFPHLREISGFLVLYRLRNLTTLAQLFPQLTVIRGLATHDSYALVIFDLPDLQDMALPNLRRIYRGGIRVESAPKLCYYRSVNFSAILSPGYKTNFHNVPDKTLCRDVCPGDWKKEEASDRTKIVYK
uniref:Recep_L_domain domain-containing protein n=2 Tax=Macrostomum lignano TaxID=282301 RepID=A0A1I8IGI8_9PLAT